jgi:hypothetical protein
MPANDASSPTTTRIVIVDNWFAELKQRVPTN